MDKLNLNNKQNGELLNASDWNSLAGKVDEIIDEINTGDNSIISTEEDQVDPDKTYIKVNNNIVGEFTVKGDKGTNLSIVGNNNINIEPRAALGTGEDKNDPSKPNRKGGNIALKPGDDIELWAHKRGTDKNDEVSVKIMTEVPKASDPTKTDEVSAKLQLDTADIVLTSKDKQEDSDVMNIVVNKAQNTRGYLKVRAQAIDLRCEENGGIALQPKGEDNNHHQNKIKFEHNGGDGLEFGTFNTQKTSIFTNEYRFNRFGKVFAVDREAFETIYNDPEDPTSGIKKEDYPTQGDDFKDVPMTYEGNMCTWNSNTNQWEPPTGEHILECTWGDIVRFIAWAKANKENQPWENVFD